MPEEYGGLPTELSWKIFIDRYTVKDQERRFEVGDLAVVQTNDDPKWPKKELGRVISVAEDEDRVEVELLTGAERGERLVRKRRECDRPIERSLREVAERIAGGLAAVEPDSRRRRKWAKAFADEMAALRVVPGGRVWAGAGTGIPLTLFNCYVLPNPKDSRQGIVDTLGQMIEIMSRGGGVGINVSSLRPYRAVVHGVNGRSSGAVSWMELYSLATGLVEQGGCFGPDERIATTKGLIPAEELYRRIDQGERFEALTHEGPRPITAHFANGVKKLYRVTTARGFTVEVTLEHRMGVLRDGVVTTVPLSDLAIGDEILDFLGSGVDAAPVRLAPVSYERSKMSTTLNEDVRLPEALTPKLAYLVGYMHGDGYVHVERKGSSQVAKAVKMATSDDRPEIRERLVAWSRELFGIEPAIEPGDGACATVALYSRVLVEWLAQNGLLKDRSEAVRVPELIFRASSEVMGAFVAGYFDADGCDRARKGGYGFDSASLGMLRDIQQLLAVNGVMSHIRTTDRTALGWRPIHRLAVTGAEFKARFRRFTALSLKARSGAGARNHGHSYPRAAWRRLNIGGRYYQGLWDSTKPRISYRALARVRERLAAEGARTSVVAVERLLSVLPDRIVSIEPSKTWAVYDFEVAGTHMLSGGGLYTSNSRRGALMLQLDIRHPDWRRFVDCKKRAGKVENANISLRITDDFMAAVKENRDWTFWFPDTSYPGYDDIWTGDFDDWERRGLPRVEYETLPAREVWNEIIKGAWESAEPGVVFSTRHEKDSNSWYFNPLVCTNPCVTGDTLVATEFGYTKARELVPGMRIRTPKGLKGIDAVYNNGVQRIFRVEFSDGDHLDCTRDHKLRVVRGKTYEWVPVGDLVPGDRVLVAPNECFGDPRGLPLPALEYVARRKLRVGDYYDRTLGLLVGSVMGDGTLRKVRSRGSHSYQCRMSFGAGEERWLERFEAILAGLGIASHRSARAKEVAQGNTVVVHRAVTLECYKLATLLAKIGMPTNVRAPEKALPEDFLTLDREFLAGVLDGLFSTDGSVVVKRDNPMLRFHTSSRELARQVRRILLQFGIHGRIYRSERDADLTYDGRPMAGTGESFNVVVMNEGIARFHERIGLSHPEKAERLRDVAENWHFLGGSWTASVVSVTDTGRDEEVFDVHEPETLTWVTNGYVSFDCAEQPLPPYGVCTLGHINLARMYDGRTKDVDWDQLAKSTRILVRLLDDVVDATHYFIEENRRNQMNERRIGAGTLGLGELLIKLGLRYGSKEAVEFTDRLYRFIAVEAYRASAELAEEKGPFPAFDADKFLQSGFMKRMPEEIRQLVREKGMRNVTVLTQAPTGTVGSMMDTSTGIEPFYSLKFTRKSRLGLDEQHVRVAQEWLAMHPGEKLPDFFVGAMDLTPEEHIAMQAAVQRWTDSSISKTANAPADYTLKETSDLYMLAYDMGCKGVTVYRDRSRYEQVLTDASGSADATGAKSDGEGAKTGDAIPRAAAAREVPAGVGGQLVNGTWGHIRPIPRPKRLVGFTDARETPLGKLFLTLNTLNGHPVELFATIGRAGSDVDAFTDAVARLVSLALRSGVDPQEVADQLIGIGGSRSVGFGPNRVRSVPDAIGQFLSEMLAITVEDAPRPRAGGAAGPVPGSAFAGQGHVPPATETKPKVDVDKGAPGSHNGHARRPAGEAGRAGSPEGSESSASWSSLRADICPACGVQALVHEEGCAHCYACGHSEC